MPSTIAVTIDRPPARAPNRRGRRSPHRRATSLATPWVGLPKPGAIGDRTVYLTPDVDGPAVESATPGFVFVSVPVFCSRLVERIVNDTPGGRDTSLIDTRAKRPLPEGFTTLFEAAVERSVTGAPDRCRHDLDSCQGLAENARPWWVLLLIRSITTLVQGCEHALWPRPRSRISEGRSR